MISSETETKNFVFVRVLAEGFATRSFLPPSSAGFAGSFRGFPSPVPIVI
jgi:hypothetical protein